MRLDKFLKVSRLIKRRTVAKEVCDAGKVTINGRLAKAGTEVQVGDVLAILFGEKTLTVRIDDIQTTVRANEAVNLYTTLKNDG